MPEYTTPAKPKSKDGKARPAQVIDEVEVPMEGPTGEPEFHTVKLVAGTGRFKRQPRRIPTRRVIDKRFGNLVTINVADFNAEIHAEPPAEEALEAPKAPAPAPTPEPPSNFQTPAETSEGDAKGPAFNLSDANVDEATEYIMTVTTAAELDALEELERNGKGRKTVMRALVDRRDELS